MTIADEKAAFIKLCLDNDILRFGSFTLKSGRVSPYFFNAGLFHDGALLAELGQHYARLIARTMQHSYMLYGPAYKGIPLAAATAIALHNHEQSRVPYAFNRKEEKDHGEGGNIVGSPLQGDVVIIDDVITAGTSVGESVDIIKQAGANPSHVFIAVDRQESVGESGKSAISNVQERFGLSVHAIITLDDLVHYLDTKGLSVADLDALKSYRQQYAVSSS